MANRTYAGSSDHRIFSRTASTTKRINIYPGNYRGGIRL